MDESLGFSVDAAPDAAVKKQLSQKDGKAQRRREQGQAEREAKLARLIFRDESLVDKLDELEEPKSKRRSRAQAARDDGDEGSEDGEDESEEEEGSEEEGEEESEDEAPKAAWVDEDDATLKVDVMQQKKLRKLRKTKKEAVLQGGDYEERLREQWRSTQRNAGWAAAAESDLVAEAKRGGAGGTGGRGEALLRSAAPLLASGGAQARSGGPLATGKLSMKRLTNLNEAARSQSIVSAVQWHPNGQMAMASGMDKVVHLFRVDGEDNPEVQAVHVPRMQIRSAAFSPDGSQILMCGERSTSWGSFDLHAGRMDLLPGVLGRSERGFRQVIPSPDGKHLVLLGASGSLLLLSAKTKQLVATLQPGGGGFGCQCAVFSPGGELLYAAGLGGKVQVWDVARRCCVHVWNDSGGLRTTALAASADGEMVAAGSDSGAVSLYGSRSVLSSATPEPLHEMLNIRHPVSTLAFNPQSELLTFASKYDKAALRVMHVGGGHIFPNWPTSQTPLGKVECCAFSPGSGYMAVGNHQGKVLLWRLNHYQVI